jgi:hypothetical protein
MTNTHQLQERLKPAIDKKYLLLFSGLMWMGVGIMLISFVSQWLKNDSHLFPFLIYGFAAAMVIHHFGFLRLAKKNIKRILSLEGKPCAFSFMTWKSYLLVMFMVAFGITLRHSLIPKNYLSVLYLGIGLALFLSSIRYLRIFFMGLTD